MYQQNNKLLYHDDIIGQIDTKNYDLENIICSVYNHYSSVFKHHEWEAKDLKDCRLWTHKTITDHNQIFDPRNRNIIQPEQHFDIVIDKPWANYSFNNNGQKIEGKLAIKGTVDLIVKANNSTLEVIDYKTGKRLDWATGQEKTLEKLYKDPQLKIYYYALSKLYPSFDHVIMTINFINDGGAFSLCFDKKDIEEAEDIIRKKFEAIKNCKRPKLSKTWKCNKLCHFGKNSFSNPLIEYRDGQLTQKGCPMTMCEQIKHEVEQYGLQTCIDMYTSRGYNVSSYKAPGSTE